LLSFTALTRRRNKCFSAGNIIMPGAAMIVNDCCKSSRCAGERPENSYLPARRAGETGLGPIRQNLFRRHNLLRRTGKMVLEFSGPVGDMNLNGFEAAVLHPQAELFVDFLDPVLLEAIAHAQPSGRGERIAMEYAGYFGRRSPFLEPRITRTGTNIICDPGPLTLV
jgi:hypothetical protein